MLPCARDRVAPGVRRLRIPGVERGDGVELRGVIGGERPDPGDLPNVDANLRIGGQGARTLSDCVTFFQPRLEELHKLTRDDPSAFAPPPAFGPFRVLHQVGVGALGPVFRTYEPTRDRLVAVKVFRLDVTPEQAQSLADELSVAADAGLFHPSVVEPIAAGVEGTVAYRAEEYVAAETLDVALRHYAPAPIEKVLPLITQLAGAIDFARSAGVGHGALHPRDIFVSPEEARATGFGVVEALERVGLRAPVRRPYSAPERVAGATWGATADVFSLAVIAYELLTGRRPAGTGAHIGTVTGTTAGHHPGELHAVFVRAMDDDPSRRYETALAFASALDAAARGDRSAAFTAGAGAIGLAGLTAPEGSGEVRRGPEGSGEVRRGPEGSGEVRMGPEGSGEVPTGPDRSGDVFGAEEPDFDDVMAEKADDEAHAVLLNEETENDGAGERSLFDDEEIDDLAHDEETRVETDRFADEFSLAAAGVPRAADTADVDELAFAETREDRGDRGERDELEDDRYAVAAPATAAAAAAAAEENGGAPGGAYRYEDAAPADERAGFAMLPVAIAVVLALLVGFAAGHAVGRRSGETATAASAAPVPEAESTAVDGKADVEGKPGAPTPYSEGAVTQPAEPAATPPAAAETTPAAAAAEEKPAPETRATTGRVLVRSTPAGANVTVDGRWRGRTPLTLEKVPFGEHEIRVVRSGYAVATEDFTLSTGTPSRTLSFRLQRSAPAAAPARPRPAPTAKPAAPQSFTGSIYVDSRPRGAQVLLDGRAVGTTPVRIPDVRIGSHVIRLQLTDHRDWTTSTRVTSGEESRVTGSLERIR